MKTRAMTVILWVAGALVFLAGFQLFVLTEHTDRFFAWTVNPPLTAAVLGASYWASGVLEWTAARRRSWDEARIAVPGVFVFTLLTFVVTLVHLDKFHFGSQFEVVTQVVTWLWLAIYAAVPVLLGVAWWRQPRAKAAPDPDDQNPGWLQVMLWIHLVLLGAVGVGLMTGTVLSMWPWDLTPLTARALGAWAIGLAVTAGQCLFVGARRRAAPAGWGYIVFGVLQSVALVRYGSVVESYLMLLVYVAFLGSTVVVGLGLVGSKR